MKPRLKALDCGIPSSRNRTHDGLIDFGCRNSKTKVLDYLELVAHGFPAPITKGGYRGGPVYQGKEIIRWVVLVKWASATENAFMNVIEQLKDNYDEAQKLWKGYDEQLTSFRSAIKNDVTSLEAAARKTTDAVQKMLGAYGNVVALMNGQEMQQAVANAERLAAAMNALANLQSHKLTVAVIDNEKQSSEIGDGNG